MIGHYMNKKYVVITFQYFQLHISVPTVVLEKRITWWMKLCFQAPVSVLNPLQEDNPAIPLQKNMYDI